MRASEKSTGKAAPAFVASWNIFRAVTQRLLSSGCEQISASAANPLFARPLTRLSHSLSTEAVTETVEKSAGRPSLQLIRTPATPSRTRDS